MQFYFFALPDSGWFPAVSYTHLAVQAEEDGAEYVFCLVGNKAVKTPVSTGNVYLDGLEITEGLEDSDRIIINPAGLTDGELVVPEEG